MPHDSPKRRKVAALPERAAIVARVCERIAEGVTVKAALTPEKVNRSTMWRWLQDDAQLLALFERARIAQAHSLADDVVCLADTATQETANAVRLSVDARKWYAAKLAPRLFSDRVALDHGGSFLVPLVVLYDATAGAPDPATLPNGAGVTFLLPDNGRDRERTAKLQRLGPRL